MHEWGLAQDLVSRVLDAAKSDGTHPIKTVRVRIGSVSGISVEAFSFAFDASTAGTRIKPGALEVTLIDGRARCRGCETEFADPDGYAACPSCAGADKVIVAGRELMADSIVVEDENDV